jgi:hypothetical protein
MTYKYKFWMVFAEGGGHPNKQHWSKVSAELEAIRLAQKNRNPVYVLESVSGYEVPPPTVSKFNTDDAMPSDQEVPK